MCIKDGEEGTQHVDLVLSEESRLDSSKTAVIATNKSYLVRKR